MSLQNFLNPRSVAIVGASNDKAKIGRQVLDNIIAGGFAGKIFPVNLKEKRIAGLKAFPSLSDLPVPSRAALLAVIVIPAPFVPEEIEKCARLGIKDIIIISAGFKESGEAGEKLETEITRLAAAHKLNILGPNCLGMINTWRKLNATFAAAGTAAGNIALLSQSGAIGAAALDWLKARDFNFGYFISLGNKAVIDENEIISHLAGDKRIDLIVAYLEGVKDGKRLMSVISRLAKQKPVAILKAGRSAAGGKLALSHTGSLAGSEAAIETGLKRAGAIWLESLEEMFNLMLLFRRESWHNGNCAGELNILTNAGGVAVLAADEISRQKLLFGRSLDILGDADAKRYEDNLRAMLADKKINNLLVLLTPQSSTEPEATAAAVVRAAKKYPNKLIMASFLGGEAIAAARDVLEKNGVPSFDYPEEAVRSFKKLAAYKQSMAAFRGYRQPKMKTKPALKGTDYLESLALLRAYGIPTIKTYKYDPDRLGSYKYPAVLKIVGPDFLHKSDKKAVRVGLRDSAAVKSAARIFTSENRSALRRPGNYFAIQEMAAGFQEIILGFKRDASFGPVIMAGLGGIYAEVFKEVRLAADDIDFRGAMDMISGLKIYPILNGARGQKKYDIRSLAKIIVNLARLANEHPEIKEFDINPLFVFPDGCLAGDVRIVL